MMRHRLRRRLKVAKAVEKGMSRLCSRVGSFIASLPERLRNSSLQIVIFSLLFHYWYDPALFSIFYPIFVFCVALLSNPQQLSVPLYERKGRGDHRSYKDHQKLLRPKYSQQW